MVARVSAPKCAPRRRGRAPIQPGSIPAVSPADMSAGDDQRVEHGAERKGEHDVARQPPFTLGDSHPHYLGLRNFRMNWSVCPRIVWSNTLAVRGSAGLARI